MEIFLNEKSVHGQYNYYNVKEAVVKFLKIIRALNESMVEKRYLTTAKFFSVELIQGVHVNRLSILGQDLWMAFLLNIRDAVKWEGESCQEEGCSYLYNEVDYFDSSVGEIAERHLLNPSIKRLLVNFESSNWGNCSTITVAKSTGNLIPIECLCDGNDVDEWLIQHGLINPNVAYSETTHRPPKDYQTILVKTNDFIYTHRYNQGRKMYVRKGFSEFWVVDNCHFGADAHIEVFDSKTGRHMGTSPIDRTEIRSKYKDPDKFIDR